MRIPSLPVASQPDSPARAVAAVIVATTVVRLAMATALGLGIDESYMAAAGRAFRLGYFDHPPLSWWLSAGAAHLAGSEAAWIVRLPFIALFAVSTWLMYRLTATLFSAWAGVWAAAALNLTPVFGVTTGGWVLPDGPLVCALLATALCLARALEAAPARSWAWWLGTGVAAGLALLSKYSAGLIFVGAFAYLATQPAHRRWLVRPQPYVAVGVAAALFAPVIVWNATHGWASFAFQGGRAAAAKLLPFGPLATLGGEALFLLPWIWLVLVLMLVRGLRAGPAQWRSWLLCCLAMGPIVLFAVVSLWSRRVLYHWAAPGYLFLFPLLGDAVAEWRAIRPRAVRLAFVATAGIVGAGLLLVAAEARWNWLAAFAPGFDPALQALDWTPLREELAARGLLDRPNTVLAAPDWAAAGKIDYALGGAAPVICLSADGRQYALDDPPSTHIGQDVLIVAPGRTETRIRADDTGLFDRIEPLEPAMLRLPGRAPVAVPLFLGVGLRASPG